MCVFQTNCDGSAVFDRVVIVPYCSLFCFLLDPIANKAAPSKTLKIVLMSERRMSCSESGQSSRFFFNPQAGGASNFFDSVNSVSSSVNNLCNTHVEKSLPILFRLSIWKTQRFQWFFIPAITRLKQRTSSPGH